MSDVKISELPAAGSVLSTTILPTVTSSTTEKATVAQLADGLFSTVSAGTYGSSTYSAVVTVDSKGRITNINQTLISGGGGGSTAGVFNVRNYGATGNGSTNDYAAISTALSACIAFNSGKGGTLYFPSGTYYIGSTLTLTNCTANITILGDGPKTSVIKSAASTSCINFQFAQSGYNQPYAVTIASLGFQCAGVGPTNDAAVIISYNVAVGGVTTEHRSSGPVITNCEVRSIDDSSYWVRGIDITSAWNTRITDTYVSGHPVNDWNNLAGVGLFFHRSCVNSAVHNCQFNFFVRGIKYDAIEVPSQGLLVTDCYFVAVKSGGYFDCAAGLAYNLSSIIWSGGIIDIRVAGTSPASPVPALYAVNTNDLTISNVQFVTDTVSVASCGVQLDSCTDVSVLNSVFYGFTGAGAITTSNTCQSVLMLGNRFVGAATQVALSSGTSRSIYRDSILYSCTDNYTDLGTNNILEGSIAGAETSVYLSSNQSIPTASETNVAWTTTLTPSQFGMWTAGSPSGERLYVPTGAKKVRLTANVRWAVGVVGGYREMKIKDTNNDVWAACSVGAFNGDMSITTPIIPVGSITYFYVTVYQATGSALDLRGVKGTNFTIEVIG